MYNHYAHSMLMDIRDIRVSITRELSQLEPIIFWEEPKKYQVRRYESLKKLLAIVTEDERTMKALCTKADELWDGHIRMRGECHDVECEMGNILDKHREH